MIKRRSSRNPVRKRARNQLLPKNKKVQRKPTAAHPKADFELVAFGCFCEWSSDADEKAYRNL